MRAILFGATGMVGSGVLKECLDDPRVEKVLVLGRGTCGVHHEKLEEILHGDFFDYSGIEERLRGYDAGFFCLGVSAAGMSEEKYHRLTYDLTMAAAETLARLNPDMTFCYVSGAGTDSTEKGRSMWARVKGKTENALLRLPFEAAYMFRPGYIQPMKGVRSKTRLYQTVYNVVGPFYPLLKRVFPNSLTTSRTLGRAMIQVVLEKPEAKILAPKDINGLAGEEVSRAG